ncbi:MAG: HD domain-containing protein [Nitrososphaerales archaeon]
MEGILSILRAAGRLKQIQRTGWKTKVHVVDAESVADHSFRVSLASMLLSDLIGLDTLKVVRMALIHDLAESIIGDLTPEQANKEGKEALEDAVALKLLSGLPEKIKQLYINSWREWTQGGSREANLVREVDALEMALQAEEYAQSGYDQNTLLEFKRYASTRIKSKDVMNLLKMVVK